MPDCTEDELVSIFEIMDMKLKERHFKDDIVRFEIHYLRTYFIALEAQKNIKTLSFYNEFVNFGEGLHGIAIPINNVADLLLWLYSHFMEGMQLTYNGTTLREEWGYTMQELEPLVEHLNHEIEENRKKSVAKASIIKP